MPSPSEIRRCCHWCLVVALGLTILWLAARSFKARRVSPPFSVRFTGEISSGLHLNPFGHFVLSNRWNRPLRWSRSGVEAPLDPDIGFSASVDSHIPIGTLPTGASTNFPALIPHRKGIPFRVIVGYASDRGRWDRIREKLGPLPIVDRFWPPPGTWRNFTSQWFYATADYTRDGTLSPEPMR